MKELTQQQLTTVIGGSIDGQYYDEFGFIRPRKPWEPVLFNESA